jgi:hypothetical protein
MTQESIFSLIFAPEVIDHLRVIDKKYHNLIRETISQQLTYNPLDPTRNRKLLKPLPYLRQLGNLDSDLKTVFGYSMTLMR